MNVSAKKASQVEVECAVKSRHHHEVHQHIWDLLRSIKNDMATGVMFLTQLNT
jgi:hypothetical protein